MKRIVLLFMTLYFGAASGQVQKLGELSSGRFLDSAVIMEEDESDVFGYCLLYELDRKSKEVFELEYVVLDKNLNKLTSISMTQAVFKIWVSKTRPELTFVKKIGKQLTIGVNDRMVNIGPADLVPFFNYRFINVDLNDFSHSKEFKYENFVKQENTYKEGDKLTMEVFWNTQKLIKTKSDYLFTFAVPEKRSGITSSMEQLQFKRQQSVKRFAVLDKDMKIVWSKDINSDKKEAFQYGYLDSDSEILLVTKEILIKKTLTLEVKSIEAYDIKTGKLLGEIMVEDKDYDIDMYSVTIAKDKIYLFASTYNKKGKSLGYGHLVFDKQTISETGRDFIFWKDVASVIPGITEFGETGKEVWHMAQDFILTAKGNTLMVVEAFKYNAPWQVGYNPKVHALLEDMYLIEFNPDKSIAFSKKIEKKNSVDIGSGLSSMEMKKYGVFDYIFHQKINKQDDFVMYYTLNDQVGDKKKMAKKPLWTLGFISNVNGEYGFETLPLYGDGVKIYPGLAKNGYIRLLEVNQKTGQAEMRLEKINY